jgi:hypothetical protein
MGGFARKRRLAIAVTVLVICVAAPEMAAPAGAVAARSANRSEVTRPAVRPTVAAKRRKRRARRVVRRTPLTVAQRKARLVSYLKAHPGVVATKLGTKSAKVKHPAVKKRKLTKPKRARKAKPKLAPRRRATRAALLARAAKKPKAVKTHPLGITSWTELLILALFPFGAVGAMLLGTDRARRPREPRAPSPSKRRRTLVITPMRGR